MTCQIFGDEAHGLNNDIVLCFTDHMSDLTLVSFARSCQRIHTLLEPVIDQRARVALHTIDLTGVDTDKVVDVLLESSHLFRYVKKVCFNRNTAVADLSWKRKLADSPVISSEDLYPRQLRWPQACLTHERGFETASLTTNKWTFFNMRALVLFIRKCPNIEILKYSGLPATVSIFVGPTFYDMKLTQFLFLIGTPNIPEIDFQDLAVSDDCLTHLRINQIISARRVMLKWCSLTPLTLRCLFVIAAHIESLNVSGNISYWSNELSWFVVYYQREHPNFRPKFEAEDEQNIHMLNVYGDQEAKIVSTLMSWLTIWRHEIHMAQRSQDLTIRLDVQRVDDQPNPYYDIWSIIVEPRQK